MYTITESEPQLITKEVEYSKVFDFQVEIKGERKDLQICVHYLSSADEGNRLFWICAGDTNGVVKDNSYEEISDWIVEILWNYFDELSDNTEDYSEETEGIHDVIMEYIKKEELCSK